MTAGASCRLNFHVSVPGPLGKFLRRRLASVYYGWWIIAAGSVIHAVGALYYYGFTVFFLPVAADLGLNRAATSLIFSLARLEGSIDGPIVGLLIDRLGPRRMVALGGTITGLGFLILSQVSDFWAFLFVYMGLIAVGFDMGFFQSMLAAANQWFIRYRTTAMSLLTASFRLGGALLVPLISAVVLTYGWRVGAVVCGLVILAFVVPLSRVVRRSPEEMGLQPDGRKDPPSVAPNRPLGREQAGDFMARQALRTAAYWLIALATALRLGVYSGLGVHFVPIFVWKGLSEQAAANLVGLMAFLAIPAGLTLGWLGDRVKKTYILAAGTTCQALAMVLLAFLETPLAPLIFVVVYAASESVGAVNWSLIGEFFGRRSYATLRGVVNSICSIGVLAPVFAGWVFDHTRSYQPALMAFALMSLLAALLYVNVRRPQAPGPVPKHAYSPGR